MANQASVEAAEAAAARAEASTALQRIGALEARMQARPSRGRRDGVRQDVSHVQGGGCRSMRSLRGVGLLGDGPLITAGSAAALCASPS